ncbi:metal ABC transporter solute-binding protein, Zn/Mn family [Sporosarcina siberiensis]|uniref:Metal ABC transporter solute-binding protein, Zn/Mn family n=1 Tax=Sporosarcina siberiensis TaxID=1365606 RepID=A0ABW4SHM6_9BACL
MKKSFFLVLSLTLIFILTACTTNNPKSEEIGDKKLNIYTTVFPLQYFAKRIGGDHVDVKSVYPTGADEHTFDPTQKEMIALADADLFFYIGLGLEGFVENAENTLKNEHVKMVATSAAITEDMLSENHDHDDNEDSEEHHSHDNGALDPHVWMSPILSDALAFSIKESLIELIPEHAAEIEKNFEEVRNDLLDLDRAFIDMAFNAKTKTFFVSHAAFGYIADTYGLEQVAIAGLNSQSEPSQKQLAALVEYGEKNNVEYVLFEQNVSSKLTDVIRKEIGADSLMLHNLGVLTVEDVENNEDYFSLMYKNIETLEQVLN